jgi:small subunit ribosomal protein S2
MQFASFFANLPDKAPEFDLKELLDAGLHFGHQKTKWNPKMRQWIYMEKNGVHIFDLAKTAAQLRQAYNAAYALAAAGKTLVMVATKKQAREIVEKRAKEAGISYIISRWLGGTLTKRTQLEKDVNRMMRFFAGIKSMPGKPDALFIIDPSKEVNAVLEAVNTSTPVIALVDSNTDPDDVDVVIPGNDDAVTSIELVVNAVAAGYEAGKKAAQK